jgi:hypothetical protein
MSHNTVKLNGVIDINPSGGAPTYIPGEYSPTPLIDLAVYYPSPADDVILVDCLYTIHDPAGTVDESGYIGRYIITYRIQGGGAVPVGAVWESQQLLFEFNDCNGSYTTPNHLFIASNWSDGLVLIPDPYATSPFGGGLGIGRVMYDVNIIIR